MAPTPTPECCVEVSRVARCPFPPAWRVTIGLPQRMTADALVDLGAGFSGLFRRDPPPLQVAVLVCQRHVELLAVADPAGRATCLHVTEIRPAVG